ncbi:MAG: O-antigen ligase family protein [Pyrinomonadaceae bacterium]
MKARLRFFEMVKQVYFILVPALIILHKPSLPLNTIAFDYINLVFLGVFLVYFSARRKQLRVRLAFPFLVILLGSVISMFNSIAVFTNIATLIQDLYLYIVFIAMCNVIENDRDMRTMVLSWIVAATIEAALNIADLSVGAMLRAEGTFDNPNAAGYYLAMSFFLITVPYIAIPLVLRIVCGVLIILGMLATKSTTALIGFMVASITIFLVYWLNMRMFEKIKYAITAVAFLVLIGFTVVPRIIGDSDFLNRGIGNAADRSRIWTAGYDSFVRHPFGIGPGGFKMGSEGPLNKEGTRWELHSDYISYLVERGMIGFLGLVLLFGALGAMILRSYAYAGTPRELLWALGLGGIYITTLVNSLTHEGLHSRFAWIAFAIIATYDGQARRAKVNTKSTGRFTTAALQVHQK